MRYEPQCPPSRRGDGGSGGGGGGDGPGERGSSLLSGMAVLAGVAVTGVSAAASAAGRSSSRSVNGGGSRGGGGGGERSTAAASEEVMAARLEEVARVIGEVADKVLKHVSDRMPGLEAWTISTLDTIFAPRLVMRYVLLCLLCDTAEQLLVLMYKNGTVWGDVCAMVHCCTAAGVGR